MLEQGGHSVNRRVTATDGFSLPPLGPEVPQLRSETVCSWACWFSFVFFSLSFFPFFQYSLNLLVLGRIWTIETNIPPLCKINPEFQIPSFIHNKMSFFFRLYYIFRLKTGIYKLFPPIYTHSSPCPPNIEKKDLKNTQRLFLFLHQPLSFEDFTIYGWSGGKTEFSEMQTFLKRPGSPLAPLTSNDLPTETATVWCSPFHMSWFSLWTPTGSS